MLLMRYAANMKFRFLLSTIFLAALSANASAEVEKFMRQCDGKLCPYFRLKFTPPNGWVLEVNAMRENQLQIYVPRGKDFGDADAVMYIRISYNSDKRSLDKFIEVAHQRWREAVSDTKIDKLANEKRTNGLPDYQIYHFVNPSRPQQAFETMAYGEDTDKDNNPFFVMIALTGAEEKAIEAAESDYRAGLRAH
jgi:hypothetical protein